MDRTTASLIDGPTHRPRFTTRARRVARAGGRHPRAGRAFRVPESFRAWLTGLAAGSTASAELSVHRTVVSFACGDRWIWVRGYGDPVVRGSGTGTRGANGHPDERARQPRRGGLAQGRPLPCAQDAGGVRLHLAVFGEEDGGRASGAARRSAASPTVKRSSRSRATDIGCAGGNSTLGPALMQAETD